LEVDLSGHEADHLPPTSTWVKVRVKLYLHLPICLYVRHRANFMFMHPSI